MSRNWYCHFFESKFRMFDFKVRKLVSAEIRLFNNRAAKYHIIGLYQSITLKYMLKLEIDYAFQLF